MRADCRVINMNKHTQSKTKRGDLQRITQTKNRPATMEQKQLIITVMKTQSKGKHEVKLHTDIMRIPCKNTEAFHCKS
jgi:hypothetical protein